MELKHLRYLVAVSEETTFIRAAERLHLAQPALSRQIHKFEKEIGARVFERGRTGVTLTACGRDLPPRRTHYHRKSGARRRVGSHGGRRSRWHVQDICLEMGDLEWILRASRWISCRHGAAPFGWRSRRETSQATGSGFNATKWTSQSGRCLGRMPANLHCEVLLNDVVDMAILSENHPLARRRSIKLSDLAGDTLLIYDDAVVNYDDYDLFAAFRKSGFDPDSMHLLPSSEALIAMVGAGRGWSIHRRSIRGRIPGVAMVPIEDFDFQYPVALLRREDETRPIVFTVMRRIRQLAAKDYPDMYHAGDASEKTAENVQRASAFEHQLDLRDLRYFTAMIEEETIGRAADRLGLAQPTLSRQTAPARAGPWRDSSRPGSARHHTHSGRRVAVPRLHTRFSTK